MASRQRDTGVAQSHVADTTWYSFDSHAFAGRMPELGSGLNVNAIDPGTFQRIDLVQRTGHSQVSRSSWVEVSRISQHETSFHVGRMVFIQCHWHRAWFAFRVPVHRITTASE